ncbi:MAG: peroxidase family protein [Pseudomonadota bacterium]
MWHLFSLREDTARYHRQRHQYIMTACQQWQPGGTAINAGFTYWGQFLAHELGPRPEEVPVRSGRLDLDSVYGPGVSYGEDGRLAVAVHEGMPFDLPRRHGVAQIPDPRNDENLIVAQFHLLILQLHNALSGLISRQDPSVGPEDVSRLARRSTIRIFHHITREQYLRKVLWPSVYDFLFEQDDTLFTGTFAPPLTDQLPMEVTHGALRFGHSMVREEYTLNEEKPQISLRQVFELTGPGGLLGEPELPAAFAVSWPHFFNFGPMIGTNSARPIDPSVIPAMTLAHDIVEKNLEQGYEAQLPSGQEAVAEMLAERPELAALGLTPNPEPLERDKANMPLLETAGIADRTPLWVFTLLDSTRAGAGGRILGPFGSLLVGSALKWAMETAEQAEPGLPSMNEIVALTGTPLDDIQDVVNLVCQRAGDYA